MVASLQIIQESDQQQALYALLCSIESGHPSSYDMSPAKEINIRLSHTEDRKR